MKMGLFLFWAITIMVTSPSCGCVDFGWSFVVSGELVDLETGGALAAVGITAKFFENDVEVDGYGGITYLFDEKQFGIGAAGFSGGGCGPQLLLTLLPGQLNCPQVDRIELTVQRLDDDLQTVCREDVFQIYLTDGVLTRENKCSGELELTNPIVILSCPN